jgi:hypothetical protein
MKFKFEYVLLVVAVVLQIAQLSCKKKATPETPVAKTFELQLVELDGSLDKRGGSAAKNHAKFFCST